ncbi:MAG TPA: HEAT repeat domain-containing protein [Gemmatimonadales bacterium]|jgi:HEAT repeat protein|nr:HEAT repeat domain-containing protein [Gemmatimonadales bacterium]
MIVPQTFATLFARTLDLFRDPAAKEDQKVQFRALVALLKADAATVAADGSRLRVNGTTLEGAMYAALVQRLELHAVGEIVIPAGSPPSQVFELLKALAEQPSEDDMPTRLRARGADRITVTRSTVPHAPATPKLDLGTDGIVHGEHGDVASVPVAEVAAVSPDAPPPPAPAAPPPAQEEAFGPSVAASRSTEELLADLLRKPTGPHVSDLLAALGRQLETALRINRIEQAMEIVAGIVRAEQQVGDEGKRRQYSIALKRMYNKPLIEGIAHLAGAPGHREEALLALQRAGEDGVEVLLDLLVAAPTIEERRGVFAALTGMKEGTDQLVHMLGHHQWFVVRNVAELVGELGLEEAVPALGRQLEHDDERVRKAVALALAKIGSRGAAEPLRRALKDKSPEVRIQAALGVGGRKSSALAMPLVVAMGEEEDETVEKELMLALGRIGSPDAVQALIKFAQPGGKLFGRKPAALRVTAVEALRLAATPAAVGTIEGLTADGDKTVRAAAQTALADLKRK